MSPLLRAREREWGTQTICWDKLNLFIHGPKKHARCWKLLHPTEHISTGSAHSALTVYTGPLSIHTGQETVALLGEDLPEVPHRVWGSSSDLGLPPSPTCLHDSPMFHAGGGWEE